MEDGAVSSPALVFALAARCLRAHPPHNVRAKKDGSDFWRIASCRGSAVARGCKQTWPLLHPSHL